MPPKDFYSPAPDGDISKLNRQRVRTKMPSKILKKNQLKIL